jgi:hypothetical protein
VVHHAHPVAEERAAGDGEDGSMAPPDAPAGGAEVADECWVSVDLPARRAR